MFEAFFHCFIVESWVVICVGVGAQRDVTAVSVESLLADGVLLSCCH